MKNRFNLLYFFGLISCSVFGMAHETPLIDFLTKQSCYVGKIGFGSYLGDDVEIGDQAFALGDPEISISDLLRDPIVSFTDEFGESRFGTLWMYAGIVQVAEDDPLTYKSFGVGGPYDITIRAGEEEQVLITYSHVADGAIVIELSCLPLQDQPIN
ncbi:MAG: hypothetical protein HRU19_20630 [Pseudobacteriovorax sp.]|nr:hypothetical protein [Pseudobacteriovorax sp.]